MAICGDTCTITVAGGSTFEGHKFTIDVKSTEENVRKFGDSRFGSWISCSAEGTITVEHYVKIPNLVTGGSANIVFSIPSGTSYTANSCICTSMTSDVDAKGVVMWTTVFKMTGAVTSW